MDFTPVWQTVEVLPLAGVDYLRFFGSYALMRSALGVRNGRLGPCPQWPNCVSSDATDKPHAIAPLVLRVPAAEGWAAARIAVAELARTHLIAETSDYLHAESSSARLGFVDDVELHLRAEDGLIAVRSASRLGFGDMGVNRRRIEELRAMLAQRAVVKEAPTRGI